MSTPNGGREGSWWSRNALPERTSKIGMVGVLAGGLTYAIVPRDWYLSNLKPPGLLLGLSVLVHMLTLHLAPRLPGWIVFLLIASCMFLFMACLPKA